MDITLSNQYIIKPRNQFELRMRPSPLLRFFRKTKNSTRNTSNSIAARARQETARLCVRYKMTVSRLVTAWNKAVKSSDNTEVQNVIVNVPAAGNLSPKATRISTRNDLFVKVREFIHAKRSAREKISATEVLLFLIERNECTVTVNDDEIFDEKDYKAALRSTQRYLYKIGFCRGTTKSALKIKDCHIAQRNAYLRMLRNNRAKPVRSRLIEVYTDESYINHHHRLEHYDLFHPENYQELKTSKKSYRFYFVAAIAGPGRVDEARLVEISV